MKTFKPTSVELSWRRETKILKTLSYRHAFSIARITTKNSA